MAETGNLIDFSVIESHKENIQALPSGRSAKALAQLYSPPLLGATPTPSNIEDANTGRRKEFEQELLHIDEADDPLDVYDRYVKWALDAYPSAQGTAQSGLLPLLERATRAFQTSSHYKNDPRYLKIWLHYIRLFSDVPREVFVFLARHGIGEALALYYEEFAAWLENAGRWNQAEEIYRMGLEKQARPAERLLRKFREFEKRQHARPVDAAEPTSPALPTVRPALAAKIDPFAAASPSTSQPQQARSTATKKLKSAKMAIFADGDEPCRPESGGSSKGWDDIGTLADRKKENSREARPWAGEKLKTGKTNGGMEKMMVFRDQSSRRHQLPRHLSRRHCSGAHAQQCVPNPKTGRIECVFVNLEAVYPNAGTSSEELCFEELRARHRGWLDMGKREQQPQIVDGTQPGSSTFEITENLISGTELVEPANHEVHKPGRESPRHKQRGFKIFEDAAHEPAAPPNREELVLVESFTQSLALNDENIENAPPVTQEADLAKRLRREEKANRTRNIKVMDVKHISNETKTIHVNMNSPTGPKLKRKKSGDRVEPTMTINTKEAMDEIYGIFSQPLPSQADEHSDAEDEDSDDDYTTGDESTGTGKLSEPASEYGDETRNEIFATQQPTADDDGRTHVSEWSDFTTSQHVPRVAAESTQETDWEVLPDQSHSEATTTLPEETDEDVVTPLEYEAPQTRYVPVPPEGYEPPQGQYRDAIAMANNRLPFMTPIVEQTESSLSAGTARTARTDPESFYGSKTPSRKTGIPAPLLEDDEVPYSSPFQEMLADVDEEDKRKVLQPIRTKTTMGTISLGKGTAKAQIAARTQTSVSLSAIEQGPFIKDERCNPMDPQLRQTILSQIQPPMRDWEGYHEHLETTSGRSAEIKRYIRNLAKAGKNGGSVDKTAHTLSLPPMLSFENSNTTYTIKRELGAGTFAPVYLAETSSTADKGDADPTSSHRHSLEAIKMEDPPSTWEFYMLRQTHSRLDSRSRASIIRAHEMHVFRDEVFLVEDFRDQGTLLDLVNLARVDSIATNAGFSAGVDEPMAMWLTVELLRTVEALHAAQLIHGDLKGDNVLVRFEDAGAETDWSPTFFASGAHGWASKGVCLIDLGRGIDMRAFQPNVAFLADWKTSEADCPEMRDLRPWTYQIDYYGLAGIIHSLLFGKYMETLAEKGGALGQQGKTYRVRETLKRYWQTELWAECFHLLLNPLAHVEAEAEGKMPVVKGMRRVRERMEAWLEEHAERGMGLKVMVGRMEGLIREKRRKGGKA